jgi:hypothetical protein
LTSPRLTRAELRAILEALSARLAGLHPSEEGCEDAEDFDVYAAAREKIEARLNHLSRKRRKTHG